MAARCPGSTTPWPNLSADTATMANLAVESAYRAHAGSVTRYLLAITRDASASEDIAQEAFLRLSTEMHASRTPHHVGAWLRRVGFNLATSRGRRASVAERRKPELVSHEHAQSPEVATLAAEEHRAVLAVLDTLGPTDRTALILAARGYRGAEIASRIGRTEGATRTVLCRARTKVRMRLVDVRAR
jgi:RNA polymerase sigma-70 factor (ECF subfamily)